MMFSSEDDRAFEAWINGYTQIHGDSKEAQSTAVLLSAWYNNGIPGLKPLITEVRAYISTEAEARNIRRLYRCEPAELSDEEALHYADQQFAILAVGW